MKRIFILCLFMILPLLVFPHNPLTKNFPETRFSQATEIDKPSRYSGYREETLSEQRKISFRFSSITTNNDPGNGAFRYNRDSLKKVTYIFLDEFDLSGEDQTDWYMQWKKAAGTTGKVRINIIEAENKNINVFYFKGVFVRENGYWRIPAEYVSGSMPVDGEIYYFELDKKSEPAEEKEKPENVIKPEESRQVAAVTPVAETEKESHPIEPPIQSAPTVSEAEAAVDQSVPSPATSENQPAPVKPEQAATDNYPMPGQQRIATEENKPEPQMQAELTKESNPGSAQSLLEKEEVKPETAVAGAVTVESQSDKPSQQPRTRVARESKPEPRYQATANTQTRQESKPVQSTRTSQPAQPAPSAQPKTSTQSSQPQRQTQVQKEIPAGQPAPKTTQSATRPAQPESRPPQQYQVSPTIPYQSSGAASYGNVIAKRTDGSRIWHGIIETGYGFKVSDYGINNYRINFISSFSLGQHFMIGLGAGYRRYFDKPETHTEWYMVSGKNQIPVFLDLRYLFSKKQLTPYMALGIGGTTEKSKSDTTSYGSFINPSAGIWYRLSKNTALFAGVAYEGLEMEFAKPVDNIPFRRKNSSVSLNIGIQF